MSNFQIENNAWEHGIPMTEENMAKFGWAKVVRCRDCRHFNGYHGKCHRQRGGVLIDDRSTRRLEDLGDVLVFIDAEQNGFCAWGERKEGSE